MTTTLYRQFVSGCRVLAVVNLCSHTLVLDSLVPMTGRVPKETKGGDDGSHKGFRHYILYGRPME